MRVGKGERNFFFKKKNFKKSGPGGEWGGGNFPVFGGVLWGVVGGGGGDF